MHGTFSLTDSARGIRLNLAALAYPRRKSAHHNQSPKLDAVHQTPLAKSIQCPLDRFLLRQPGRVLVAKKESLGPGPTPQANNWLLNSAHTEPSASSAGPSGS